MRVAKWEDVFVTGGVQHEIESEVIQYRTIIGDEIPKDICNCLHCGATAKSKMVEGWLIDHPSFYEKIYYSCDEYTCPECEHVWQHRVDREYSNAKKYILDWVKEVKEIADWFR